MARNTHNTLSYISLGFLGVGLFCGCWFFFGGVGGGGRVVEVDRGGVVG